MNKKIVWEHVHSEEDKLKDEPLDNFDDDYMEDDDLERARMMQAMMMGEPEQLVQTPFGLFRVNDVFNPLKQYVWWIGHTNFNVSPKVGNILNDTPGVEWVKVISRYRFLIAVGKAFEFSDVRASIEESLEVLSTKLDEIELISELQEKHAKWAVFFFNDETYDVIVDSEFDEEIDRFIELQENNKGKLLTHNDF